MKCQLDFLFRQIGLTCQVKDNIVESLYLFFTDILITFLQVQDTFPFLHILRGALVTSVDRFLEIGLDKKHAHERGKN